MDAFVLGEIWESGLWHDDDPDPLLFPYFPFPFTLGIISPHHSRRRKERNGFLTHVPYQNSCYSSLFVKKKGKRWGWKERFSLFFSRSVFLSSLHYISPLSFRTIVRMHHITHSCKRRRGWYGLSLSPECVSMCVLDLIICLLFLYCCIVIIFFLLFSLLHKHTFTLTLLSLFTVSPFSLSLFIATHARNIFESLLFCRWRHSTQLTLHSHPLVGTLSVLSLSSLFQLIFSPPSDPGHFLFLLFVESVQCIIISACWWWSLTSLLFFSFSFLSEGRRREWKCGGRSSSQLTQQQETHDLSDYRWWWWVRWRREREDLRDWHADNCLTSFFQECKGKEGDQEHKPWWSTAETCPSLFFDESHHRHHLGQKERFHVCKVDRGKEKDRTRQESSLSLSIVRHQQHHQLFVYLSLRLLRCWGSCWYHPVILLLSPHSKLEGKTNREWERERLFWEISSLSFFLMRVKNWVKEKGKKIPTTSSPLHSYSLYIQKWKE